MATFILVHGAFGGGWAWEKVAPVLTRAGHRVIAPTLTGLAERAHLATPDLGLGVHIQDIVEFVEFEDLREVVLVGHSYGGMVIAGVADRAAERLAQLVYVDAHAPQDGESLVDLSPPGRRTLLEETARAHGSGWLLPAPSMDGLAHWVDQGRISADDVAWVRARRRPQPLKTFLDPVTTTNPDGLALPRTYIYCSAGEPGSAPPHLRSVERAKAAGWRYHELPTGHVLVLLEPDPLVNLLLDR
jgi:pimeloyl-ACP methyl ester carboxylesterase